MPQYKSNVTTKQGKAQNRFVWEDWGRNMVKSGFKFMLWRVAFVAAVAAIAAPVQADAPVTLGWGRMFANDALGDGHDRWRTGSYQVSLMRGVSFSGTLPASAGELMEYRANAQIVAPENLQAPTAGDRRYAALLSFGAHTQFDWRGSEMTLGADMVLTGPQTGISNFQKWVHHAISLPEPAAVSDQIENGIYPTFSVEMARSMDVSPKVTLRPFAQAQAGVESFVRLGGDLMLGGFGRGTVMVRDQVTGQRYRVVEGIRNQGVSVVLGADVTRVFESALLPSGGDATPSPERSRLRAGVNWQGEKSAIFYGVSYLGREFEQQAEGQVVGALNLSLKF